MLTERNREALELADRLRSDSPDIADCIERMIAMAEGKYERAREIARRSELSSDPTRRSYGYEELASLAADRGDYPGAIAYLNQGLEEDSKNNNPVRRLWKLIDRAYLAIRLRDFNQCLQDVHEALHATSSPWLIAAAVTVLGNAYANAPVKFRPAIRAELTYATQVVSSFSDNGSIFEFVRLRTKGELELAARNPRAATVTFGLAAIKDAPVESREYVGRAFVTLARSESSKDKSESTLRDALRSYSATALGPRHIWCEPSDYLPGFFGDQLESYLEIAKQLGVRNGDIERAEQEFRSLRATSLPN